MSDSNLPDSCQGNDPSYPWNQTEIECPKCGSYEVTEEGDKWEGSVTCDKCGHVIESWDNIPIED